MTGDITYQAMSMPQDIMQKITSDDSPDIFFNWFWEFMGIDIQNANIQAWDFENILDMIDIAFANILGEYKESDWKDLIITKVESVQIDGKIQDRVVMAYHISKLWDMVRAKVYTKMTRAREGFTLRQITESKSEVKQHQTMSGYPQPMGMPMVNPEKKKGWRI